MEGFQSATTLAMVQPRFEPDSLTSEVLTLLQEQLSVHLTLWPLPVHDETDTIPGLAARTARLSSLGLYEPVVACFAGLFIDSCHGFPGLRTPEVVQQIGPDGIIRILGEQSNRSAHWMIVIAFCEPGRPPQLFQQSLRGEIATRRMNASSYIDSVFHSASRAQAETEPQNDVRDAVRQACARFLAWYKHSQSSRSAPAP